MIVRWLAIAAVVYVSFLLWSGWSGVVAAASAVGSKGLALLLLLSVVNYLLRFVRWQSYLASLGYNIAWQPSIVAYIAGFAFTVTPGKLGELLRGSQLDRLGVPMSVTASAFVAERLSDLTAVVLLALVGLSAFPHLWTLVCVAAALVVLATLLLSNGRFVGWMERRTHSAGRAAGVLARLLPALANLRRCLSPRLLAWTTLLGVVGWFAEVSSLYLILDWLGHGLELHVASFIFAAAMIAGALTFLPGGLGGTEVAMMGLLVLQGLDKPTAALATVLFRIVTLWFAVALGCAAVYRGDTRRRGS